MSEQIRESVSALIDNEANELELERLLSQSAEPQVRDTVRRYQLAGSAMRGEGIADFDISQAVMQAIDAEATAQDIQPVARKHLFSVSELVKPLASFAVAASVFAAVLVGNQLYGLTGVGDDSASQQLATQASPVGMVNTVGGATLVANYGSPAMKSDSSKRALEYNQLAQEQLKRYLLPHTDQASLNTPQGMMPYSRIATLKVEEKAED